MKKKQDSLLDILSITVVFVAILGVGMLVLSLNRTISRYLFGAAMGAVLFYMYFLYISHESERKSRHKHRRLNKVQD